MAIEIATKAKWYQMVTLKIRVTRISNIKADIVVSPSPTNPRAPSRPAAEDEVDTIPLIPPFVVLETDGCQSIATFRSRKRQPSEVANALAAVSWHANKFDDELALQFGGEVAVPDQYLAKTRYPLVSIARRTDCSTSLAEQGLRKTSRSPLDWRS